MLEVTPVIQKSYLVEVPNRKVADEVTFIKAPPCKPYIGFNIFQAGPKLTR